MSVGPSLRANVRSKPATSHESQSLADRVPAQLNAIMNAELVHDSVFVAIDRFLRATESDTDFFDAQSARQMSQNASC